MSKRSREIAALINRKYHEMLEKQFLLFAGNFVDLGLIGSSDFNDPRGGLVYDPHEKESVSFGINYDYYFWEIFEAIEDPITKAGSDEEPMAYIRRLREDLSTKDLDQKYSVKSEIIDVQLQ
jgi:hypothetical protein